MFLKLVTRDCLEEDDSFVFLGEHLHQRLHEVL